MINKNLIGKTIKQARINKKVTQETLAEAANISSNYLSKIERGLSIPTADSFLKIIEFLNMQLKDFEIYSDDNLTAERIKLEKLLLKTNNRSLKVILPVLETLVETIDKEVNV